MKALSVLFAGCLFLLMGQLQAQVAPVYSDPLNVIQSNDPNLMEVMAVMRTGDAEGALRLLKKNKSGSENSYAAYFLTGVCYRQLGDLTNAIQSFSRSVHEDAYFIPGFFERGNCYLYRQNYGLAVFDYDRVLLLDSMFLPAYNNRAYARLRNYGEQGNPVQQLRSAKQDLERIIQIGKQRGEAPRFEYYFNIGLIDLFASEYALAAASFDKAIQADTTIPKAYYYRGAALFLARSYEEAAKDFRQSENMGFVHPNTPEFLRVIDLIEHYQNTIKE
ncbi:MAG: hypothetical protein RLZZ543_2036 [Bacteroidota bacterium]